MYMFVKFFSRNLNQLLLVLHKLILKEWLSRQRYMVVSYFIEVDMFYFLLLPHRSCISFRILHHNLVCCLCQADYPSLKLSPPLSHTTTCQLLNKY